MPDYSKYKENPASFNKQCYDEWKAWFDLFKERTRENYQLYNNYSEDLAARIKDETLKRAGVFVPVINPTVLARSAYMANLLFSVERPIKVLPKEDQYSQQAQNVEETVFDFLQKDDFRLRWLMAKIASGIFPISFLQICETEDEESFLKVIKEKSEQFPQADIEIGKSKKWSKKKGSWRPTLILRTQESVFYDPTPSEWKQKRYIGTITPLTLGELVERKTTMGYEFDIQNLKDQGEKFQEDEFLEELNTASADESKQNLHDTQRYKVIENWHLLENEKGQIEKKITVSCGNVKLKEKDYPYHGFSIPDPFIPIIGYPVLNRVEGITTADHLKHLQHVKNDIFNLILDFAKYGLFPPTLIDSRAQFESLKKISPASRWYVDPSGIGPTATVGDVAKQLFNITPTEKDFFALLDKLDELIEVTGGAPQDIMMGVESSPEEKLGKTQLRAQGASSRLAGINVLMDVEVLKNLARVIWIMTLERLSVDGTITVNGKQFGIADLNGRFEFKVPHLEGLQDREQKAQKLEKMLARLMNLELLQNPQFAPTIYMILKKLAEYETIEDFDKMVPAQLFAPPSPQDMIQQMIGQIGQEKQVTKGE